MQNVKRSHSASCAPLGREVHAWCGNPRLCGTHGDWIAEDIIASMGW